MCLHININFFSFYEHTLAITKDQTHAHLPQTLTEFKQS